jgi:hypothetical protein
MGLVQVWLERDDHDGEGFAGNIASMAAFDLQEQVRNIAIARGTISHKQKPKNVLYLLVYLLYGSSVARNTKPPSQLLPAPLLAWVLQVPSPETNVYY